MAASVAAWVVHSSVAMRLHGTKHTSSFFPVASSTMTINGKPVVHARMDRSPDSDAEFLKLHVHLNNVHAGDFLFSKYGSEYDTRDDPEHILGRDFVHDFNQEIANVRFYSRTRAV
jgi:hypothetical protein